MNRRYLMLLIAIGVLGASLVAQPVSVMVNGVPGGASFVTGSQLTWTITLPPGGISTNDLWVDVNLNGRVDVATDRLIFRFFQQDGMGESDGPADMDGAANGTIFTQFDAGLAPASWIFVAANGVTTDTATFTVLPLVSPVATITGQVSAPVGVNRMNILVQAESEASLMGMKPFWHALTDADGNYTIQMGGTPSAFNPWRVRLETQMLGRLVPQRPDTTVSMGGSPPVVNFQLVLGTVLTGRVVDQSANPVAGSYPHVHPASNPEGEGNLGGQTDPDGRYAFVLPPGSWLLHFTQDGYKDQWWNGKTDRMQADVITTMGQDSIKDLNGTIVKAGEIRGVVRNWGQPTNATVWLMAMPGPAPMMSRQTQNDGSYSFTVDPGTYYIKFEKDMDVQYWDHTSMNPGMAINIMGTETVSGIDGDFNIGMPPPPPGPGIIRVWDYPFDNGRQVYLKFRGVEQLLDDRYKDGDIPFGVEKYTIWRFDKAGLVYAGMVPAAGDSVYVAVVPTLLDSTITDGVRWSRYIVRAHFLFNLYVIPSQIDSGYSLDNLAPNVPGGVGSAVAGNDVRILWDRGVDEDLRYYTVYRGTTENFSVAGLNPLARTADAAFVDPGAATGTYFYRITATDFSGNESAPSLPVSSTGTTAVRPEGETPTSFGLGQNYPNPFNPSTVISFDVPVSSPVRLEVYNALGQQVAELVNATVAAGRHAVRFDAAGLPSGLYLVRMHSGEFAATRKINLVK